MKKLSIFAVCALLALSACTKNDDDTTPKTNVKASFGEKSVSNPQKTPAIEGVFKTSGLSTTICRQEPCNVKGFTVTAKCNELEDVINSFKITTPTEGESITSTFDLADIYVGENTFTTNLNIDDSGTFGVGLGISDFTLDVNGEFAIDSKTNLEAKFLKNKIISDTYTIKESGNTEIINLGDFVITNGGAKIKFLGDGIYKIKYIITSAAKNTIIETIPLDINSNKAVVINDELAETTNSGKYTVSAEVAYDGTIYHSVKGSKEFQINKAECLRLGISLDANFNIVVKDLGNITMTIQDFTLTGEY